MNEPMVSRWIEAGDGYPPRIMVRARDGVTLYLRHEQAAWLVAQLAEALRNPPPIVAPTEAA